MDTAGSSHRIGWYSMSVLQAAVVTPCCMHPMCKKSTYLAQQCRAQHGSRQPGYGCTYENAEDPNQSNDLCLEYVMLAGLFV